MYGILKKETKYLRMSDLNAMFYDLTNRRIKIYAIIEGYRKSYLIKRDIPHEMAGANPDLLKSPDLLYKDPTLDHFLKNRRQSDRLEYFWWVSENCFESFEEPSNNEEFTSLLKRNEEL